MIQSPIPQLPVGPVGPVLTDLTNTLSIQPKIITQPKITTSDTIVLIWMKCHPCIFGAFKPLINFAKSDRKYVLCLNTLLCKPLVLCSFEQKSGRNGWFCPLDLPSFCRKPYRWTPCFSTSSPVFHKAVTSS